MIPFLKTYKAFFIGLIVIPIIVLLAYTGFINIPYDEPLEILFVTVFYWLLISLPIHYWSYLKRYKKLYSKIIFLILLLISSILVDSIMGIPDNPLTFSILMGFWIGFVYVLIPSFIKKYWKLIVLIYGPLFLYFLYLRLFSGNLEGYLKIKEDFPIYIFFLPIPALFCVWVFEQWKWIQNLKAEKSKAELSLLRTQINPHFFFNTLNNLYALTVKNSKQAPEVILKLSDMMRYTIYEGEKDTVQLKDEIDYLKNYIELHKIRYKKSVEITFKHDIDIHLSIAPLLFIILLENAFKHGVESIEEHAYIHIDLFEDKDFIYFKIANNFDTKQVDTSNGIGLQNLKRRLSLLYYQKYELQVHKTENVYKTALKIFKHA